MYITPINSFKIQPYTFKGTLNDSVKTHINGTVKKGDDDSESIANKTIEELENYMENLHPDTELRNQKSPKIKVEFYNSLLDITVPIARRPAVNKKGQRQVCISESYPDYLSKSAVKSCRQFSEGLKRIPPKYVDNLFLEVAVAELAKNAASNSAKAWYRNQSLIEAIIEYQKNIDINKRISREQLRKIVQDAQKK